MDSHVQEFQVEQEEGAADNTGARGRSEKSVFSVIPASTGRVCTGCRREVGVCRGLVIEGPPRLEWFRAVSRLAPGWRCAQRRCVQGVEIVGQFWYEGHACVVR